LQKFKRPTEAGSLSCNRRFACVEFTARLAVVRSIPEASTACQEWASRNMQLNAENAGHLLADRQKLMETGARLLSNGGSPRVGRAAPE
jgi:hypothetical protein